MRNHVQTKGFYCFLPLSLPPSLPPNLQLPLCRVIDFFRQRQHCLGVGHPASHRQSALILLHEGVEGSEA